MAPERTSSAPRRKPGIGRSLVAHLGAHPFLARGLAHQAGFPDRVRQRLLAIDVLAQTHGRHRGRGVRMVGRRDDDGVDLGIELMQQLAIVVVLLGFLVLRGHRVQALLVDVAHRHDPAVTRRLLGVALAFAADADAGDIQRLVRPDTPGPAPAALGKNAEARDRRPKQERPTVRDDAHEHGSCGSSRGGEARGSADWRIAETSNGPAAGTGTIWFIVAEPAGNCEPQFQNVVRALTARFAVPHRVLAFAAGWAIIHQPRRRFGVERVDKSQLGRSRERTR